MLCEHFGRHPWKPRLIRAENVSDDGLPNKPAPGTALWVSPVGCTEGWYQWCQAEGFHPENLTYTTRLAVDDQRIFRVDNLDDLARLPVRPKTIHGRCIDFARARQEGIWAIHLTANGQWRTRFPVGLTCFESLYGWDCECVCVLDSRAIQNPTESRLTAELPEFHGTPAVLELVTSKPYRVVDV